MAVLGGCGTSARDATQARAVVHGQAAKPKPKPKLRPHRRARVVVTVVDGDTNRRLRGARVRIGHHRTTAKRHGVAVLRVRRAPLVVTASRRGYAARSVRFDFRHRRRNTIRLYAPKVQWPRYGATPARTQTQLGLRVRPPFHVVWSRGMGSLIEFPAVVANGVAFIGNARGTVRALSMRTGELVWRRELHQTLAASAAVWGDKLVVHTMGAGRIYVLRRSDGRILWTRTVGSPVESSPLVVRGVDYFGAWNGRVYALDLRKQRLRWTFRSGYKITSSVAAGGGRRLYVGDYGGRLLALSRSGHLLWARSVGGRIYGTPAVAGGRVFVPSSTGGSLTAFSTSGRYLWRLGTGSYVYSSPATWAGRVFVGSYNGVFYCVSARTGHVLWEVGAGGAISGAAVVVDGVAYAGSFGHRIVGVSVRTGRVLVRFPHGEYVPVSGSGTRLLLHGYSRLYAVESQALWLRRHRHPRHAKAPARHHR
jgi:outer membrane protein assembly factor BamB